MVSKDGDNFANRPLGFCRQIFGGVKISSLHLLPPMLVNHISNPVLQLPRDLFTKPI